MKKSNTLPRIQGFLVAILMIFTVMMSLPTTTFAANNGTLTLHKLDSTGVSVQEPGKVYKEVNGLYHEYLADAEYSVYQIGTFAQEADPVAVVYTPVSGLTDIDGNPITVLNASTEPSSIDVTNLSPAATGTTTATGPLTFDNLNDFSVYLIKETYLPDGVHGATDFIITVPMFNKDNSEWEYSVDAYPKNTYANASIEKTIVSGADAGSDNVFYANVGDVLNYQVDVTVPADIQDGKYTQFDIVDTSSQYLQIDTTSITVTGAPAAGGTAYNLTAADGDFTMTYSGNVLTLAFTEQGIGKLGNGDALQINYDAEILSGASDSKGGVSNEISLKVKTKDKDIDPITPDPDKPDPEVRIYSYGVKKLGDDGSPLADATFVLAEDNGSGSYNYLIYDNATNQWSTAASINDATAFVTKTSGTDLDSEAILQFRNLDKNKTYYLFETIAPNGYATLPSPVEIAATENSTDHVYASYALDSTSGSYTYVADTGYSKSITNLLDGNNPGSLPNTGGQGTYIFIAAGLALIVLAAGLLVYYRKKVKTQ
ncbi:SpaH/EbpB family LPXTG-anchored major pilin [Eubacterium sp. 1001713B170207_170306_E7]|uniref:SpaH/EbpB family LPXTG-anchored major pilin n=1 Tax=Eubacterium sp. 1001713B170207_170306_E7 TaxID=2787097 RepID=UPI00189AF684|nr:SpaH/EbpB family LPXTG-anchored major pilin [Eubacterium sp. 1001713B170207_170306_E7]